MPVAETIPGGARDRRLTMPFTVIRYSEHPECWDDAPDISGEVWPEYNLHGEVLRRYWARLYEEFAQLQFVLYDDDVDEIIAEGHTIPCDWDGQRRGCGTGSMRCWPRPSKPTPQVADRRPCARWPPRSGRVPGPRPCRPDARRDVRRRPGRQPAAPDRRGPP